MSARLGPRISRGRFFDAVFFRVTHDGPKKKQRLTSGHETNPVGNHIESKVLGGNYEDLILRFSEELRFFINYACFRSEIVNKLK